MGNKSKLTLVVDGNWLLMSRMPVLLNNRYADERTVMKDVKLLMIKSINIVLKTFPDIDNVIVVSDGGSWRNDIPVPEFLKQASVEYKGNREKSEDVNWDVIFEEYNNFVELLNQSGINAVHETGIEGDDWCWYWSDLLNKQGTNVMIWTKDRDITQLVKTDSNGVFTIVWNKDNGVFMAHDTDDTQFLLNPYYQQNEAILRNILNKSESHQIVNPLHVRLDKIIRGDLGDNILPIITRKAKTGEKTFRVQEKHLPENINDIYNIYELLEYVNSLNDIKMYSGSILQSNEQIIEHYIYNRQLVVLDEQSYPESIFEIFHKYDHYYSDHNISNNVSVVESKIQAEVNTVTNILNEI